MPSRMPRPDSEIGTTCAIATAGMNAMTAPNGTPVPDVSERKPTVATTDTWYTNAVPSTPSGLPAVGRAGGAMPSWTAPMNRVQFSLPSNRPAALGWPARKRIVPSAASAMPETSSATHAVSDSSSAGSMTNPSRHSTGSARNPVSRSSATAANAVSVVPTSLALRDTRTTSPPMVDGRTLPTN